MDGDLMTAAKNEAGRLLREQREFLLALEPQEGLLHSREDGKKRVLDNERVDEIVEVLDGEADKITRLEITLAVAGTVKAGKSTAINAIVGTEVLPNRNTPMTALPTVIRHKPNLREPQLTVNNAPALDGMAREIAQKLQNGGRLEEVRKAHDADMKPLIDDLAAGRPPAIGERHQGKDGVFGALGRINDLLRLGRHEAVGVELPMEEYDELHEMPSLDVHFRSLADVAPASGALALLDLPGFNEARMSERLTEVLEEQLEKASAVLVILDYTQLNTEASEELEMLIDAVSGIMADRIFVLVNKYDQRRANDAYGNADILRKHIAADTMKGKVDPEHVYPVSAQHAYLASRALEDLNRRGRLPSPDDEAWVSDFAKEAFSSRDRETGPSDPERAREEAEALWLDSKFDALLKDVVVASQNRAATLALQSALGKLQEYGSKIEDHLNSTVGSLTENIETLQEAIRSMSENTQNAETIKAHINSTANTATNAITKKIDEEVAAVKKQIEKDIEDTFKDLLHASVEHKDTESQQAIWYSRLREKFYIPSSFSFSSLSWLFKDLSSEKRDELTQLLIDFNKIGQLKYDDEKTCEEALKNIHMIYSGIATPFLAEALRKIQTIMENEATRTERDSNELLENVLREARQALKETGIKVSLSVPGAGLDSMTIKASEVELSRHVKTRPFQNTEVTHRLANFLDVGDFFGWGKETVITEEKTYVIDRDEVIGDLQIGLEDTSKKIHEFVKVLVEHWRTKSNQNLDVVIDYVNRYIQVLIDGISQRKNDQESAKGIVEVARQLQKKSEHNRFTVKAFQDAIEDF